MTSTNLAKFFLFIIALFISDLAFANSYKLVNYKVTTSFTSNAPFKVRGELKQMDRSSATRAILESSAESSEFDVFYKTYKELKVKEKWESIVSLCDKTIADVRLPSKEEAIVNVILEALAKLFAVEPAYSSFSKI